MKFLQIVSLLILISSCNFQSFSTPDWDEEKIEMVNSYLTLLEADNIEFNPMDHDWENSDLPILIENSKLIEIEENGQLTNVAVVDTVASILWDAVLNKNDYQRILIGFVHSSGTQDIKKIKGQWLEYPTKDLK